MKRVTPEEAVRVYTAKNAYALQGTFYTRRYREAEDAVKRCGCIVGIMGISLGEMDTPNPDERPGSITLETRMHEEGYHPNYVIGLENGFDFQEPSRHMGEHYDAGFEDGQACFLALLEAGRAYYKPEEIVALI